VYYPYPWHLVPTLPRGNAGLDAPASDRPGPATQRVEHSFPTGTAMHYPHLYILVPTLPRGNAGFDALRRTHSIDYQSVATSTNDSIRAQFRAPEYLQ
jgi:hypothetical protein